jgi:hypothetical protein
MVFLPDPSDPFYDLMKPPGDETRAQKISRLKLEEEAQRINDTIEEQISVDRNARQERKATQVMLVGQSGSGEFSASFFRSCNCWYTPFFGHVKENLPCWKASRVRALVVPFLIYPSLDLRSFYARKEWERERSGWRLVIHMNIIHIIKTVIRLVKAEMEDHLNLDESIGFTAQHRMLLLRLAALTEIEADVKRRLAPFYTTDAGLPYSTHELAIPEGDSLLSSSHEFCVLSWRDLSAKPVLDTADWLADAIADHQEHMKALWHDPIVGVVLTRRSLRVCDSVGQWVQKRLSHATAHLNGFQF